MLKPDQVNVTKSPNLRPDRMQSLEEQFDRALVDSERSGVWPAIVGVARDDVSSEEIEATIQKYRALGWLATVSRKSGVRASIDHPKRELS